MTPFGIPAGILAASSPGCSSPYVGPIRRRRLPPPVRLAARCSSRRLRAIAQSMATAPAGTQLELGDFPSTFALHPDGKYLAVLHCGYREHEIVILSTGRRAGSELSREHRHRSGVLRADISRPTATHSTPPAANTRSFTHSTFAMAISRTIDNCASRRRRSKFVVSGVATSPDGKTLYATGLLGNALASCRPTAAATCKQLALVRRRKTATDPGRPSATTKPIRCRRRRWRVSVRRACRSRTANGCSCQSVEQCGRRGDRCRDDAESSARWPTASHPTEMALRAGRQGALRRLRQLDEGQRARSDRTASRCKRSTARCIRKRPNGNTPNSLSLTPDGEMLFVANADANNLAVFNVADARRGQAARLHSRRLVSDLGALRRPRTRSCTSPTARASLPKPNRDGPQPGESSATRRVHRRPVPRHAQRDRRCRRRSRWPKHTQTPIACSPLRADSARGRRCARPTIRSRPRSASQSRSSTASTSSRRTAPTIRCSAT